jgi:hypothetical protein
MTRADFTALLDAMNRVSPKSPKCAPRAPGQVSDEVCEVWERGGEIQRVADAVIVWEHLNGRVARPGDMEAVAAVAREEGARLAGAEIGRAA